MILDELDIVKLERELLLLDEQILRLQELEKRKEWVKKIHGAVLWWTGLRNRVNAYTKENQPNPQTQKYYDWAKEYPYLLLYKGVAIAERYLASYESDGGGLKRFSDEEKTGLEKSGWINRNRLFFNRIKKKKSEK
jgi:hypothetical protein